MKKKIALIFLLILIICTSVLFLTKKRVDLSELILYGNIEIRQVDMSFQVAGQIEKMFKEEGDSVKKGDLLASLVAKDYVSNLERATAEVLKIQAINADANDKYNRQSPLCSEDIISKQDCETLLNNKIQTKASLDSAVANKKIADNQLVYTKIYAPEEGIVTVRIQEPGAIVAKGQPVYTISKSKPVWIRAYVNETDLGNVKYAQQVKVLTDTVNPTTGEKREYKGYVGYISPVAEFTPKTVQSTDIRTDLVYRIRVYINDIDEYLRQGMPTTIKIDLNSGSANEHRSNK